MVRSLEACQQNMQGSPTQPPGLRQERIMEQTIPVRITNRISKTYFSSPVWSNMSTSISLHVRNKLYKQLSYMYKQNITKSKAYYLYSLIYVSPNVIQYKNKRFPNFILPLLLANTISLVPRFLEVEEFLSRKSVDIGFITETWLKDEIGDSVVEIQGYNIVYQHGGVVFTSKMALCSKYRICRHVVMISKSSG